MRCFVRIEGVDPFVLRLEDDLLLEHYKEIVENYYAGLYDDLQCPPELILLRCVIFTNKVPGLCSAPMHRMARCSFFAELYKSLASVLLGLDMTCSCVPRSQPLTAPPPSAGGQSDRLMEFRRKRRRVDDQGRPLVAKTQSEAPPAWTSVDPVMPAVTAHWHLEHCHLAVMSQPPTVAQLIPPHPHHSLHALAVVAYTGYPKSAASGPRTSQPEAMAKSHYDAATIMELESQLTLTKTHIPEHATTHHIVKTITLDRLLWKISDPGCDDYTNKDPAKILDFLLSRYDSLPPLDAASPLEAEYYDIVVYRIRQRITSVIDQWLDKYPQDWNQGMVSSLLHFVHAHPRLSRRLERVNTVNRKQLEDRVQ
eukprot:gene1966-2993_t